MTSQMSFSKLMFYSLLDSLDIYYIFIYYSLQCNIFGGHWQVYSSFLGLSMSSIYTYLLELGYSQHQCHHLQFQNCSHIWKCQSMQNSKFSNGIVDLLWHNAKCKCDLVLFCKTNNLGSVMVFNYAKANENCIEKLSSGIAVRLCIVLTL